MTIKLASLLFGYDYAMLKKQTLASRQKIGTLALLLLIPVFIWGITGFLLSRNLLDTSLPVAVAVSFSMAGIIFLVDRSFVTADCEGSGRGMAIFRFGFAFLSAVLGAVALDMVIFEEDIANYQTKKAEDISGVKKAEYLDKHSAEQASFLAEVQRLTEAERSAKSAYMDEMDGKIGQSGYGPRAKKKEQAWDLSRKELESAKEQLLETQNRLKAEAKGYAETMSDPGQKTLLGKFRDFHEFVFSDRYALTGYGLFFILMLMLELFLLVYKTGARKTVFDKMLLREEEMTLAEIASMESLKHKMLKRDEALHPDMQQAVRAAASPSLRRA